MIARHALRSLLGLLALASGPSCVREEPARCELLGEARVALTDGATFDGIAIATSRGRPLSVWSEARGTFARVLGAGPERRVTDRCVGGVALSSDGRWLGCMRPSDDEEQSEVLLVQLDEDQSAVRSVALGAAGRDGRGMALATLAGKLYAAWEEGLVGAPGVRLGVLSPESATSQQRALSLPGSNGRQPALLAARGHLYAVWTESDLAPGGESHRLMIARDGEKPRQLRPLGMANAAPTLASDAQGLVIAYRDKRPNDLRAELYLARITDDLHIRDRPQKLGRANSEGGPSLALCDKARAAVAPLDHASELYVAFHPLSPSLRVVEENHQFYATDREFVLAATLCTREGLTTLLAERTQPTRAGSELLKVDFQCTD